MSPRTLWSLWDMLKLKADSFYSVTTRLARTEGALSGSGRMPEQEGAEIVRLLKELEPHLDVLDAKITKKQVGDIIRALSEGRTYAEVEQALMSLRNRLPDELGLRHVFVIREENERFFRPVGELFGPEVLQKYPSVSYEIDEARKCMAFECSTAAVFHLMRTLEVSITATARCLGLEDPVKNCNRNWDTMLKRLKCEIDRRNESGAWADKSDRDMFDAAHALLQAVRVAWRNTTMHIENKYTPQEAEDIFSAVRGFMRKIAVRFDERGEPKSLVSGA